MTPTDTLREAVARAQCAAGGFDPDEIMSNDGPRWRYYLPTTDAALSAIEAAGWRVVKDEPVGWQHHGPRGGWITTDEETKYSERPVYAAAPRLDATVRQNKLLADAYRDLAARQTDTEPDIAKVVRDNRSELYMPLDDATVRGEEG